jgi:hypothetical protein
MRRDESKEERVREKKPRAVFPDTHTANDPILPQGILKTTTSTALATPFSTPRSMI